MARPRNWRHHGTVERYRQGGCADVLTGGEPGAGDRCEDCKAAMAERNRNNKHQLRPGQCANPVRPVNVTSINSRKASKTNSPQKTEYLVGGVERSIIAKADEFDGREVDYQLALRYARVLDDPDRVSLYQGVGRQLQAILDSNRESGNKKKKSRGRLAAINAMSNHRRLG